MPKSPPPKTPACVFEEERRQLHKGMIDADVLTRDARGIVNVADKDSRMSRDIAAGVYKRLTSEVRAVNRGQGQTTGAAFEDHIRQFLERTFLKLGHLRPGSWHVEPATAVGIAAFEQYEHLVHLENASKGDADLAAALGTDYIIKPDVIVYRDPEPDATINKREALVDDEVARKAVLRKINNPTALLHASVSTKWTLRSDRAQNARTEALNLLRNRKGRVPHVVVVTAEPMPSRVASLALGTGDIDCVYHLFLTEMLETVQEIVEKEERGEDSLEILDVMVRGRRLKDISDLPLDLAV